MGASPDTALCIHSLGTVLHRKTPRDGRRHSQRIQSMHTCVSACTQDDGEAKHFRLCCPGPHSARLSTVRYHLLVSQLHSCSSETEALTENQDTGRNHHFLATSVLQMHCPVGARMSLEMSRSPEIYVTQCQSVTDCGSSTPCLPCGNIRSSRLKVKL